MDNNNSGNEAEAYSYPRLRQIIDDTLALANYALKMGKLPQEARLADIYGYQRDIYANQELSQSDIQTILTYYEDLRRVLVNVTPETLRHTEALRTSDNPIKRYLKRLYWLTFLTIVLILFFNIANFIFGLVIADGTDKSPVWLSSLKNIVDGAIKYAIPFTYGTLGACAYLLRTTEKHLRERDFDIVRITEHWNRLVLGTLSGGVIVLFIQDLPAGGSGSAKVAEAALGFLAGYSIDFLFDTLDRIIKAILPKVGLDTLQKRITEKDKQLRIKRIQDLKNKAKSEEVQKVLEEIIEYEHLGGT